MTEDRNRLLDSDRLVCGDAAAGGPCGRRTGHDGHHATIAARHLDEIVRLRAALETIDRACDEFQSRGKIVPAVIYDAVRDARQALNGGTDA